MSADNPPTTLDVQPYIVGPQSTLSPQTPSSVFSKTMLPSSSRCVVKCIVLCYWDNILGPRIRHLWTVQALDDLVTLDLLNYVANHTLSGEICREAGDSRIDNKFYVMKDRGLIVTSFIFSALGRGDLAVHSLSVVVPYKNLHMYIKWQPLTRTWMQRGVTTLRILLEKFSEEECINKFSGFLSQYLSMLVGIQQAPVPSTISLSDTAFHPAHKFDEAFVHKALLYHLTTCGRSVVIGNSPGRINMMIATLAMLLRPEERSRCRYVTKVTADQPQRYYPDVCIQGIILTEGEMMGHILHSLYLSEYPTALIDLSSAEIKLSSLPHKHHILQHDAIAQDLKQLWGENGENYPTKNMFRTMEEQDSLITNLLDWLQLAPSIVEHKEAVVDKFVQFLERKAVTLLQYIKVKSEAGATSVGDVKKMKQDLGLTLSGDFNIVLATAERLQPGVYSLVYNETSAVNNPLVSVV